MPGDQHKDRQNIILYLVDDAVVTDPYAVARPSFEFFITERPEIKTRYPIGSL